MESAVDGDGSCSPNCNACGLVWFDRDIETAITRGGGMRSDVVVDPDDRITDFEVGRGRTKANPCHLDNMLDRKRVVWGKSGAVRVDLGGGRIIEKKNKKTK